MLYDLTAIDERDPRRSRRAPASDFTVVYHLLSYRTKCRRARQGSARRATTPSLPTITDLWPAANWYEREVWDMFGDRASTATRTCAHPACRRRGQGHPLRKEHPARATEMGPFQLPDDRASRRRRRRCASSPSDWGLSVERRRRDFMFLNLGPQHPGTHGVLRIVLQLDGERDRRRGARHRLSTTAAPRRWASASRGTPIIPYTDRVDYLGGVMNNLAYCLAVETARGHRGAGRARRSSAIMLAELFRIASHLVWYGTFAQDLGALSPVFYMFNDRERAVRHHRGDLRRRACTRTGSASAAWPRICRDGLGPAGRATFSTYLPAAPARIRQDGDEEPHLQGADTRASAPARSTRRSSGA